MSNIQRWHSAEFPEAQQQYWDLSDRFRVAAHNYQQLFAEVVYRDKSEYGPQMVEAMLATVAAQDAMDAFRRDHKGSTFLVFRPELIDRATTDNIEPFFVE